MLRPPIAARGRRTTWSIRIIARGAKESVNTVSRSARFRCGSAAKDSRRAGWEAELSLRHCSISLQARLIARDADSHMGTFLDGQQMHRGGDQRWNASLADWAPPHW